MRLSILAAALLVGLAVADPPATPDDPMAEYELQIKADLWKGFKKGSWVQKKIHMKDSSQEKTTEVRITLELIAENGYGFKVENLQDGEVESSRRLVHQVYGDPAAIFESEKKEDVKVGGRTFSCFLQEYVTQGEDATTQRTWECADAPGVVVRTYYEATYEGKKVRIEQNLVALDVASEIAGKKVACWQVEKTTDMPKGKIVALFSADVPGGTVRRHAESEIGDFKSDSLEEVTAFEAKR